MEIRTIKRLAVGTVYKITFLGFLLGFLPLGLFFGVLALFGYDTVQWNGEQVTGVMALVVGPLIGLMITAIFTLFLGTVMALGLWVYALFRPLTVTFHTVDQP